MEEWWLAPLYVRGGRRGHCGYMNVCWKGGTVGYVCVCEWGIWKGIGVCIYLGEGNFEYLCIY